MLAAKLILVFVLLPRYPPRHLQLTPFFFAMCLQFWGRANLFSQLSCRSGRTRILGHPEVVEDQPHPAVEVSHLLRDIGDAFGFDEPDREPSEP